MKKFPEKRHPRYIPPEDHFWKAYEVAEDQDKVLLLALNHLAARKGEIFRLKRSDIDFSNSRIRLWTKKRENSTLESDWLPMTTELEAALRWWVKELMEMPDYDHEYVFVNLNPMKPNLANYAKPFTHRRRFLKNICKKADVKYFDYHAIRHLTATVLYKLGYSLGHIQRVLRHKSPTTTERYLKRLGLEMVRTTLEEGLRLPEGVESFKADVVPIDEFKKQKTSGRASS